MADTIDLGLVTAYGNAKEGGYTGTESQFNTLLANLPTYASNAAASATAAAASASDAEDAADRAEQIVGGQFVSYGQTQGLSDAQQEQARANISAGASNRNLLDNPWFTVNQRGASGAVASGGYAADRWFVDGASTVTRNADGTITLNGTSSYAVLTQRLEESPINFLVGKTVTMSLLYSDGTVFSGTVYAYANRENVVYINGTTNFFVLDTRASRRWYIYLNGLKKTLTAVKLELGSYSTLANDVPPDYGEELRKCRRYFRRYALNQTGLALIGRAGSTTEADFILGDEPMAKSTGITAAINGAVYARAGDNTNHSVTSAVVQTSIGGGPALICATTGLTLGATAVIVFASGGYIDINGDL